MKGNPLRTGLCEMPDIEYPVMLAGMGGMGCPVSGLELGVLGCAFHVPGAACERCPRAGGKPGTCHTGTRHRPVNAPKAALPRDS